MNRIRQIGELGQSIWYDYIQRRMIWTGGLHRMVEEDGLRGVTSNPAIFEAAIAGSADYQAALAAAVRNGASAVETYETLAVEDIQWACDVLRGVFDETRGMDGFVSLEVSPHLAHDARATIEEGARLWAQVDRPNLMIKVPATDEGLPAIERLITEGVNVNVTLLFSVDRCQAVFDAYMNGLESRVRRGEDPTRIASVASFFVSRIDTLVDSIVREKTAQAPGGASSRQGLERLVGKAGIASAKLAYEVHRQIIGSARWASLATAGAHPQRLLFGSTSTKNPAYRDVVYVEELIGPDTVNTVPAATYDAFKDHGVARSSLVEGWDEAKAVLRALEDQDISIEAVTSKLLQQGVTIFEDAFDRLITTVEHRRRGVLGPRLARMRFDAPEIGRTIDAHLETLRKEGFVRRLWAKDPSLFTPTRPGSADARVSLGWLDSVDHLLEHSEHFVELQEDIEEDGIEHVVVLGMGGSSLAASVFAEVFEATSNGAKLHVLDSTVPAQILALELSIDLETTLFVVASKSGSTLESAALDAYFYGKVGSGDRFVAITDPETALEESAAERGFRAVFTSDPEIGGRFSALSPFGVVPLAAMGVDVVAFLARARLMVGSCERDVPPAANPGVELGVMLADFALAGRDKITFVATPSLLALGGWLEQLLAESTGKDGRGIVPIDGEELGGPDLYGVDRVFVYLKLTSDPKEIAASIDAKLAALSGVGHPVLTCEIEDAHDLGQEMFRWEVATAALGHVLGVNPFDQPNVEETKANTRMLIEAHRKSKSLPKAVGERLVLREGEVEVYTDEHGHERLKSATTIKEVVDKILDDAGATDYVAIDAFIEATDAHRAELGAIRQAIRARSKLATTLGFGPRYLHSTGQLQKGGPKTGIFILITSEDSTDVELPGQSYTFGILKRAEERGDFMALSKRKRPLIRIHLPSNVGAGLGTLRASLTRRSSREERE